MSQAAKNKQGGTKGEQEGFAISLKALAFDRAYNTIPTFPNPILPNPHNTQGLTKLLLNT